jgi:hypothetical protein
VVVEQGAKCIEVDPRADTRFVTGIGERPAAIAEAVLRAIGTEQALRAPQHHR